MTIETSRQDWWNNIKKRGKRETVEFYSAADHKNQTHKILKKRKELLLLLEWLWLFFSPLWWWWWGRCETLVMMMMMMKDVIGKRMLHAEASAKGRSSRIIKATSTAAWLPVYGSSLFFSCMAGNSQCHLARIGIECVIPHTYLFPPFWFWKKSSSINCKAFLRKYSQVLPTDSLLYWRSAATAADSTWHH